MYTDVHKNICSRTASIKSPSAHGRFYPVRGIHSNTLPPPIAMPSARQCGAVNPLIYGDDGKSERMQN